MAITKFTDVADSGYDIAINRDTAHQTERDKFLAGLVTKIDELTDLINTHITDMAANNAKTTFPGFGTSSTTALVGNTALLHTAIPNVTVTSDRGLVVNFGNLVPGKTSGATVELTITDHNQKSAPTYTAVITLK